MKFDIDSAIRIAKEVQSQKLARAIVCRHVLSDRTYAEEWERSEELDAYMMIMRDAGWLDDVEPFNVAGDWQARLTYQGHLWLEASQDESIVQRIRDEVAKVGLSGANTVVAECIKAIVSIATQ